MSDFQNGPRVKLTELREYESQAGRTYFAGYLGGTRVLMLRDDRAEITGKEKARWTVFLEEAPPREGSKPSERGKFTPLDRSPPRETGRPVPVKRQKRAAAPDPARQAARSAADRRAEQCMRDRGLDPHAPMSNDPLPF